MLRNSSHLLITKPRNECTPKDLQGFTYTFSLQPRTCEQAVASSLFSRLAGRVSDQKLREGRSSDGSTTDDPTVRSLDTVVARELRAPESWTARRGWREA